MAEETHVLRLNDSPAGVQAAVQAACVQVRHGAAPADSSIKPVTVSNTQNQFKSET